MPKKVTMGEEIFAILWGFDLEVSVYEGFGGILEYGFVLGGDVEFVDCGAGTVVVVVEEGLAEGVDVVLAEELPYGFDLVWGFGGQGVPVEELFFVLWGGVVTGEDIEECFFILGDIARGDFSGALGLAEHVEQVVAYLEGHAEGDAEFVEVLDFALVSAADEGPDDECGTEEYGGFVFNHE